jgi:hypothetical protein
MIGILFLKILCGFFSPYWIKEKFRKKKKPLYMLTWPLNLWWFILEMKLIALINLAFASAAKWFQNTPAYPQFCWHSSMMFWIHGSAFTPFNFAVSIALKSNSHSSCFLGWLLDAFFWKWVAQAKYCLLFNLVHVMDCKFCFNFLNLNK